MSTEVAIIGEEGVKALAFAKQQIQLIQHAMKDIMIKDQHYGLVPGCGTKNVLLKAGAEKLCLLFGYRMVIDPTKDIEITNHPNGHREYRVTCHLYNAAGNEAATGVGSCSTLEGKYAFRTTWVNGQKKKTPNENIADTYNTVLKMAKKRAHVDATITGTGASDIFTQDIEEMDGINRRDAQEAEVVPDEPAAGKPAETLPAEKPAEKIPNLAIMEWSLIDAIDAREDAKTKKLIAKVTFGDLVMFCYDQEKIAALGLAHKAKKRVKVQFDNLSKVKKLVDFKVEEKK